MKAILKRILFALLAIFGILLLVTLCLLLWPAPEPLKQTSSLRPLVITNVSIIDTENGLLVPHRTIVIEGQRITNILGGNSPGIPENSRLIDGNGKFLMPGLWDMHAHLVLNLAPQLSMPLFIAGGVTGIREMGDFVKFKQKKMWQKQIQAGALLGPRLGVLAGAWIPGLQTTEEAHGVVAAIDGQADYIKVHNGPLPEPYFTLIEEARKKGLDVLGHKPRAVKAIDASNSGHKSFEHARLFLFECFPGAQKLRDRYYARYSGAESVNVPIQTTALRREMIDHHDPELFSELVAVMVRNDTWFCPTHITRKMDAFADKDSFREDPRLKFINYAQRLWWQYDADEMVAADPSPEGRKSFMDFYLKGLELTGKAHQLGLKILAGTDANDTYGFPGFSIHDELRELVKAGLTPADAIRAATIRPAEYLDLSSDYGSVAIGMVADLVMLDANPLEDISNTDKINTVIFNGSAYVREELDNMQSYVERNASSVSLLLKIGWEMVFAILLQTNSEVG